MTELAYLIQTTPMVDTHEHLNNEAVFVSSGPDILNSVFDHYLVSDLVSAGASTDAINALRDQTNPDIQARFEGVRPAWEACVHTGYGEASRWVARELFGIEHITGEALAQAAPRALAQHQPGERLRMLREVARLDHVQVDDFVTSVERDESGPEFFRYDISWMSQSCGDLSFKDIHALTGISVTSIRSLRTAFEIAYAKYAALAVATKTQHAYQRTLQWQKRTDTAAEDVLLRLLRGAPVSPEQRLCLGDWCLEQGVRLSAQHDLPVKIHCGYYAGNAPMPLDYVHASHLSPLIDAYPTCRFVLMHTAYPFGGEVIALAKHYPNVYADLCWAWSIDPRSTGEFVRTFIHTAPANKLFVFGGDSFWPHAACAYAWQARTGLTRVLQAEIADGELNEAAAAALARRFMFENQQAVFRPLS
jgi:uncharacterized protein